ncbi:MAG: hypothetical protein P1U88_01125 [Thalassobaculaceae bacterium]|nr:hypothetical protein [Thalassobaculaceae bacterium]
MNVRLVNLLYGVLVLAYPLVVYVGLKYFDARSTAFGLLLLTVLRFLFLRAADPKMGSRAFAVVPIALTAGLVGLAFVFDADAYLLFYPVAINAVMLVLFAESLARPPTVIERLARISEPDLPPSGVRYTRKVTMAWCGFFILNGGVALYTTTLSDLAVWTVYNGFVAYILMAVMFGGEYLVRLYVRRGSGAS